VSSRRACFHPLDLLDPEASLPGGYELIWMSQLLGLLLRSADRRRAAQGPRRAGGVGAALDPRAVLDRQRFEAAAFSLQQTSLYFSCVANGTAGCTNRPSSST
jgi:hypothetical protein